MRRTILPFNLIWKKDNSSPLLQRFVAQVEALERKKSVRADAIKETGKHRDNWELRSEAAYWRDSLLFDTRAQIVILLDLPEADRRFAARQAIELAQKRSYHLT